MTEKYPLEDLLRVRKFREDEAANEQTRCRHAVEEAKRLVAEREQALKDYIEWRVHREQEMYQEVMQHEVQLKALDDLKQDVLQLREQEFVHQQQVHEAEKSQKEAETALEQAHSLYQEAFKNVQKIDEHKEMWAQETAKLVEADEEKELEDFRVRSRENDDLDPEDGID